MKTKYLVQHLTDHNVLSQADLKNIKPNQLQFSQTQDLVNILFQSKSINDQALVGSLADLFQYPTVNIEDVSITWHQYSQIPYYISKKFQIIAFEHSNNQTKLCFSNPLVFEVFKAKLAQKGQKYQGYLCQPKSISQKIQEYYDKLKIKHINKFKKILTLADLKLTNKTQPGFKYLSFDLAKIIRILLKFAQNQKANEIIFIPKKDKAQIQFRIQGYIFDILKINFQVYNFIIKYFQKTIGLKQAFYGCSLARLPFESNFFRVVYLPDNKKNGRLFIKKILAHSKAMPLEFLGLHQNPEPIYQALDQKRGLIIICGPRRSGKTTTAQAITDLLLLENKNLNSLEQNSELKVKGINQVKINPKIGLTINELIKKFHNQDADFLFLTDIDNQKSAQQTIDYSFYQGNVAANLEAESTYQCLQKMINFRLEKHLFDYCLNLIIFQKLIKKICPHCKKTLRIPPQQFKQLVRLIDIVLLKKILKNNQDPNLNKLKNIDNISQLTFYSGAGCKKCSYKGYKGKIAVYEIIKPWPGITELIQDQKNQSNFYLALVKRNYLTYYYDCFIKALNGFTTVQELLKIAPEFDSANSKSH
ncbi:MAG: hypothetical protein GF332_01365 [Candidatus Moranbacteria bacterium]|nr:hypothetical protein [Candidatus Moranbacteria bacterium]